MLPARPREPPHHHDGGMALKVAVVRFPGSNADWDSLHAARDVLGADARYVFHKETSLGGADAVDPARWLLARRLPAPRRDRVLQPDRAGAPRVRETRRAHPRHLQRLPDPRRSCGLLPGALARNRAPALRVPRRPRPRSTAKGAFTQRAREGHGAPRYRSRTRTAAITATKGRARGSKAKGRGRFATARADGRVDDGVPDERRTARSRTSRASTTERRSVLGMMPHPERASEAVLGNDDGLRLFHVASRAPRQARARASADGGAPLGVSRGEPDASPAPAREMARSSDEEWKLRCSRRSAARRRTPSSASSA